MSIIPSDWIELLKLFHSKKVEYLIVGGHAVGFHGYPRSTQDLDIFVSRSAENAARIVEALKEFFAGEAGVQKETLMQPDKVLMIGQAPFRVDILTGTPGIDFAEAYKQRAEFQLSGLPVSVIGLQDLRASKQASGREQDLADLAALNRMSGKK